MNELEVWTYIKSVLEKPIPYVGYTYGICGYIQDLFDTDQIDLKTYKHLVFEMNTYKNRNMIRSVYFWPLDKEGQKERIEFCNKQIERLTSLAI